MDDTELVQEVHRDEKEGCPDETWLVTTALVREEYCCGEIIKPNNKKKQNAAHGSFTLGGFPVEERRGAMGDTFWDS